MCCCWQDVGAVALIRAVAPNLPIHGSTQMSITSAEGAEFAAGAEADEPAMLPFALCLCCRLRARAAAHAHIPQRTHQAPSAAPLVPAMCCPARAARLARPGLGVSRVVVGRELSTREISKLSASTSAEVEAFCHGALCVSYSGQCFSSEAWGGRSANRGQCAQACRMPYGLVVDGEIKVCVHGGSAAALF